MLTADIRSRWLEFFGDRGHTVVPSASLVSDDPSLLFTVAGMVPFIPYLSGLVPAPYPRATSVQKCIRTLDIEEVGKTTRHGTFFQMNGNFSFGDYFKEGAIGYAWELLTTPENEGGLGFPERDLWVTVYEDDDEAIDILLHERHELGLVLEVEADAFDAPAPPLHVLHVGHAAPFWVVRVSAAVGSAGMAAVPAPVECSRRTSRSMREEN